MRKMALGTLFRIILALVVGAIAILVWYSMADLDLLLRVALSLAAGGFIVVSAFMLGFRHRKSSIEWLPAGVSLAVAVLATVIGMLISVLSSSDHPPGRWWLKYPSILAMPGVWAMNIFGVHSLDRAAFYGGFALNMIIWTAGVYFLLVRARHARA